MLSYSIYSLLKMGADEVVIFISLPPLFNNISENDDALVLKLTLVAKSRRVNDFLTSHITSTSNSLLQRHATLWNRRRMNEVPAMSNSIQFVHLCFKEGHSFSF